ncbi:hypothetical protein [Piscirickettsia salmonis]|uniref:hypothetical protein n=1 Tax=Piscirickettsia salmonis TaxID=1238 RepID=UPI0018ACD73D
MSFAQIYSHYRNFKHYYQREVQGHLKKYFPKAVSYNRFVELMPTVLLPLCFFIAAQFTASLKQVFFPL